MERQQFMKAMRTLIDVEDDKEAAFENWLQEYTNTEASGISYTSKASVIAEYKSLSDTIEMVGVVLAIIPVIAHNRLSKRSVIDRLRVE